MLFPDSFGSRGLPSQCTVRERSVRTARERVTDAIAARHWLQGQTWRDLLFAQHDGSFAGLDK